MKHMKGNGGMERVTVFDNQLLESLIKFLLRYNDFTSSLKGEYVPIYYLQYPRTFVFG